MLVALKTKRTDEVVHIATTLFAAKKANAQALAFEQKECSEVKDAKGLDELIEPTMVVWALLIQKGGRHGQ